MDIYIYIFKFASVAFNAWVPQGFRLVWGAMGGGAAGRARAGWAKGQGRPEGGGGPGPPGAQTRGTRSGGPGVLALVHIIHIYINIHKHIIHTYESTQKHCYTPRHAPQPTCDLYVVASSQDSGSRLFKLLPFWISRTWRVYESTVCKYGE